MGKIYQPKSAFVGPFLHFLSGWFQSRWSGSLEELTFEVDILSYSYSLLYILFHNKPPQMLQFNWYPYWASTFLSKKKEINNNKCENENQKIKIKMSEFLFFLSAWFWDFVEQRKLGLRSYFYFYFLIEDNFKREINIIFY